MKHPVCPKCGKAVYPKDTAYAFGKEYHSKCQKQVCYEERLKRNLTAIQKKRQEEKSEIERCRRTKGM